MSLLTPEEKREFEQVLANAKREGWIDSAIVLSAEHFAGGTCILITATLGPRAVKKQYERDGQWPYRLLRDLAWGTYEFAQSRQQLVERSRDYAVTAGTPCASTQDSAR